MFPKQVVVDEDWVLRRGELFYEVEDVLAFHLVAVVDAYDVVKFLIGHVAVAIWVYLSYRQANVLHAVFFEHHVYQFFFRHWNLWLFLFLSVSVEVSKEAELVFLEPCLGVDNVNFSIYIALPLLLSNVQDWLDINEIRFTAVSDFVELLDGVTLLVKEFKPEGGQYAL